MQLFYSKILKAAILFAISVQVDPNHSKAQGKNCKYC